MDKRARELASKFSSVWLESGSIPRVVLRPQVVKHALSGLNCGGHAEAKNWLNANTFTRINARFMGEWKHEHEPSPHERIANGGDP